MVLAAVSLAACGRSGLYVIDRTDSSPPSDAESEAETETESESDAESGAESGAESESGAEADAGSDVESEGEADAPSCGVASEVTGDVFGNTVYFANGASLPAGTYRVAYVDGCMKYSPSQDWSVNAYALNDPTESYHWWFLSNGQPISSVIPPGTIGFLVGQGGYATFDECVQANLALPPIEITVPAGTLAVWLEDNPYSDNVAGPDGRSPTWSLRCAQ